MDNQIILQRVLAERSSALFDLTIDQAIAERINIDLIEEDLEMISQKINTHADLGFLGFSQPGGLTKLFYDYETKNPPAFSARHYTRRP